MSDLLDLARRCEEGSGGDRELDADIFQRIGGPDWEKALMRVSEPCGCPEDHAIMYARQRCSPDYTTSLDAAVSFVERALPGWEWTVRTNVGRFSANVWNHEIQWECSSGGSLPARALMASAMKALAAKGQTR